MNAVAAIDDFPVSQSPSQLAWRRFRQNRLALVSGIALLALVLLVLLGPVVVSHQPNALTENQFAAPSAQHWFGTDDHGRDLFARVLHGARISLLVGIVGAGVSLIIGVLWGAVAGYLGGRLDNAMMRFVDVLYSLPSIVFVIVLITTLEALFRDWLAALGSPALASASRLLLLFVGLGAVSWLTMARIVRGQVLSLRKKAFIEAEHALGISHTRILLRHILPNVTGIVIVYLALTIPSIILYESFLSYLGLGIQPPQASLGSLIAAGAGQINPIRIYWWMIAFPAGFLGLTLLALNFFGDGLRDALDPKGAD
jgi:oligopeptide transport system permease protein